MGGISRIKPTNHIGEHNEKHIVYTFYHDRYFWLC